MKNNAVLSGMIAGILFAAAARAADYPQFRGPNRDGRAAAEETGLLREWPEGGPEPLWKAEGLGQGYSQPIHVNGVIYVTGELENDLALSALDARTGELLWRHLLPGEAWSPPRGHPGARGTPTYDAETNQLFLITALGTLSAHSAEDGSRTWSRNILEGWGRSIHEWGYAESPLIFGDLVVFTPGGPNAISAVDKRTGEDVWRSVGADRPPHYSSAILAQVGGRTLAIGGTARGLVGVDAETGELAFTYNSAQGQISTTPTYDEESGLLFWAHEGGGITLRLSEADGAVAVEEVNRIDEARITHGGYIQVGRLVFAGSGRGLMCISPAEGVMKWNVRDVLQGSTLCADGRLYCFSENGTVVLVEPSPDGFREKGRFRVSGSGPSWAYPVVADKRLLLRYGPQSDILYAFDVAAK
jgi:outer membrane protein assembly factor BamB